MRNAMICVSCMLAVFLAWPSVFGGNGTIIRNAADASSAVKAAVAAVPAVHMIPEAIAAPSQPAAPARPESCYKRFQREVKLCSDANGAACKLGAADHWDMCEATGMWPE